MHVALRTLWRLQRRAALRQALRGVKTWRGAFLLVLFLAIAGAVYVPNLVMIAGHGAAFSPARDVTREFAPLGMLALTLLVLCTSAGERAFYFPPCEVDFLFAGPFTRRELLAHKIGQMVLHAAGIAILVSLGMIQLQPLLPAALAGVFLYLVFLNGMAMAIALVGQMMSEYAYTRARRGMLAIVGLLIGIGTWQVLQGMSAGPPSPSTEASSPAPSVWDPVSSLHDAGRGFHASLAGRILLAPFRLFAEILTAPRFNARFLVWTAAAAALDGGLILCVLVLDANYLEMASQLSQRIYEQTRRGARGAAFTTSQRTARIRLPRLPWLGGAGPVAWQQMTRIVRMSRRFLLIVLLLAGATLLGVLAMSRAAANQQGVGVLIGGLAYLSFLMSLQAPVAFRADVDHIDSLKALPVRSTAIAVGELAGVVILLSGLQITVLALGWAILRVTDIAWMAAILLVVPYNGLIFGVSNLVFLIYPLRVTNPPTVSLQSMSRAMVFSLLQMLVILVCLAIVAAASGLCFLATFSWPAALAAGGVVLVTVDLVLVRLVAWAFHGFVLPPPS